MYSSVDWLQPMIFLPWCPAGLSVVRDPGEQQNDLFELSTLGSWGEWRVPVRSRIVMRLSLIGRPKWHSKRVQKKLCEIVFELQGVIRMVSLWITHLSHRNQYFSLLLQRRHSAMWAPPTNWHSSCPTTFRQPTKCSKTINWPVMANRSPMTTDPRYPA